MTFSSTIKERANFGGYRVTSGTFTNDDGSTGGNIATELRTVRIFFLTATGATVDPATPALNETLPCDGNAVTIVTTANRGGNWTAFGQ